MREGIKGAEKVRNGQDGKELTVGNSYLRMCACVNYWLPRNGSTGYGQRVVLLVQTKRVVVVVAVQK